MPFGPLAPPPDGVIPATLLLVDAADQAAAEALRLPVGIVVSHGGEGFLLSGRGLAADRLHLAALGVMILSAQGAVAAEAIAADWAARFGEALPPRIDLSGVAEEARREVALGWLVELMQGRRQDMAGRMVGLMRDMAVLRQEHEAMQTAFARLEDHARMHRLSERKLSYTLAPVEGSSAVTLTPGAALVQRIAGASPGLSDVAVRIAEAPSHGVLTCRLESPDLGAVVAEWSIPAARLTAGWLRLSLVRGLAEDPVGLCLTLVWEGAAPLRLATAMAHPDVRFRPAWVAGGAAGRHVLALEVWHYLPGVRAPGTAKGWLPVDAAEMASPLRRVDGRDLFGAINLASLQQDMGRVYGGEALLVHVMPDAVACAILPEMVAGVRQVSVDVLTHHPKGPVVDYAIAVLPPALRPRQRGRVPEFPDGYHSGWVRLRPMRAGQVTLILPDLPGVAHDLYLMTRLPEGAKVNAYGWSGFSGLVLHV